MIKLYTIELNNNIKYVGITKMSLQERFYYHKSKRNTNLKKKNWLIDNPTSKIILLNTFRTLEQAQEEEKFYIMLFKYYGFNLLNNSEGGEYNVQPKGVIVKQYSTSGVYIAKFNSSKEAARSLNKNCSKEIRECCRGISSIAQGFVWRYKNDSFEKYKVLKCNEIQSKSIISSKGIKIDRFLDNKFIETHCSINDIVNKGYGNACQIRKILKGERYQSKGFHYKYH